MAPKPINFTKVAVEPALCPFGGEDAPSIPHDRVLKREDQEEIMPPALQKRHAKDFLRSHPRKMACKVVTFGVCVTSVTAAFGVFVTLLIVFFVSGWPSKQRDDAATRHDDDAHNIAGEFISGLRQLNASVTRQRVDNRLWVVLQALCTQEKIIPTNLGVHANRLSIAFTCMQHIGRVVFVHVGRILAPSRTAPPLAAAAAFNI
jgi:hypothetical protein